jgi:hypothetical protein
VPLDRAVRSKTLKSKADDRGAKSAEPLAMAKAMHSNMTFETVIGDLRFDKKDGITRAAYVVYVRGKLRRPRQLLWTR